MIVSHAFAEFPNMLSVQQRIHDVSGGMWLLDAWNGISRPTRRSDAIFIIVRIQQKGRDLWKKWSIQMHSQSIITRTANVRDCPMHFRFS
jgi:hypothetical protein